MVDFEEVVYTSFNDFFIRKFKTGARSFPPSPSILPAIAEGLYLGYAASAPHQTHIIKNKILTPSEILGDLEVAQPFHGGPLLICRLRPSDFHRFHYPDDGTLLKQYRVHGSLYPTNPACYRYKSNVFTVNERQVSLLETQNFGLLAFVEVGAMCVGRIIQNKMESPQFSRGQEKGYFLVGGSTLILMGEKGKWKPSLDILENSQKGIETQVRLGEATGSSLHLKYT